MKWCGAWAQGEQFWVPLELQRPRQAKDTSFIDSLRGVLTGNLDVFNLEPAEWNSRAFQVILYPIQLDVIGVHSLSLIHI